MKKTLFLFVLAALTMVSCQESMKHLSDRVFEVAEYQFAEMDKNLTETTVPKSTRFGVLVPSESKSWTSGFYPGSLWYTYLYTGNEDIKALAEKNTEKLYIETQIVRSHDIGFMVNCSYGNALRITGDEKYREPFINAAHLLTTRFNPTVGLTLSWNQSKKRPHWHYPVIIDNMMNLELLTQAHKLCGVDSLLTVAHTHAKTTMKNHFRPDFTTWHVVDYEPETGEVRMKVTHQGYSDDSAWARGQAWAVYGYTMMFRETEDAEYLAQAENVEECSSTDFLRMESLTGTLTLLMLLILSVMHLPVRSWRHHSSNLLVSLRTRLFQRVLWRWRKSRSAPLLHRSILPRRVQTDTSFSSTAWVHIQATLRSMFLLLMQTTISLRHSSESMESSRDYYIYKKDGHF